MNETAISNFLQDYVKQVHLQNMDQAQRAGLKYLQDKNIATKDQKTWDPDAALPSMEGTVKQELYKEFQEIFGKLAAARLQLREVDGLGEFIAKHYGPDKEIKPFVLNDRVASLINAEKHRLVAFLQTNSMSLGVDPDSLNKLIEKLDDDSYKTDKGVLKTLQQLIVNPTFVKNFGKKPIYTTTYLTSGTLPGIVAPMKQTLIDFISENSDKFGISENKVYAAIGALQDDNYSDNRNVSSIQKIFTNQFFKTNFKIPFFSETDRQIIYENIMSPKEPTSDDLDNFSDGFSKIVETLIKKDKIRDAFIKQDANAVVSNALFEGLKRSAYDGDPGDKNYVNPKYQNKKGGIIGKAKEKVKDWSDNHLKRWIDRTKRHIYKTNAIHIIKAATKAGVTPQTGLQSLLDNKDKIMQNLPGTAKDDFKYTCTILKKLSGLDQFKDATQRGEQMLDIVAEVIKDAVHNGKKEAGMATLETLAMLRYHLNTSSRRDAFIGANKELSIFGDPGLSWNKNNEGLAFVGKALDKTIAFGLRAGFETANMAKNLWRQRGGKFRNGTKRLNKLMKGNKDYENAEKKAEMDEMFAFWNFVNGGNSSNFALFKGQNKTQSQNTPNGMAIGDRPIDEKFKKYFENSSFGRTA